MPPRKKPSKKSNQTQFYQPSKFGIQHFFDRHSQSVSQNPNPKPDIEKETTTANVAVAVANADVDAPQISPEVTKSVPNKRFKFSPGMLIKQSQDDGGDEITWKISPVNDRLKSISSKQLPGMMRVLTEASSQAGSVLQPCLENQCSSFSVGMLEKWLSSPTTMAPSKPFTSSRLSLQETNGSNGHVNDENSLAVVECKNPFRTPPTLSYGPKELIRGVSINGMTDEHGNRQHRRQLLELLDQVEDAITEDPVPNNLISSENHVKVNKTVDTENNSSQGSLIDTSKRVESNLKDEMFLVLEVSEKHRTAESEHTLTPFKVLRLLNEKSGKERILHLSDEWFYSSIGPGDTISVIGEFDDQDKCVIDHDNNLLIIHPNTLVSGTRVASSFNCPRRAVLDERIKSSEHSTAALVGTLLHQIFQAGLVMDKPTRHFLEEYAGTVLQKNIENLYACGACENDIYSRLIEAIPKLLNWIQEFRMAEESKTATINFGHCEGQKSVHISEVIDIEEMAWAPRYGLKGMIDASIRVNLSSSSGDSCEKVMPLEFKTGKATTGQSAMEHSAQVILYTLLMADRYLQKDIDSGILYYLHTDQTLGIKVQRSDLVGLIMRRNELANDILKASSTQNLPTMLQNLTMCKGCRHLNICTVYHKAHGGNTESSGLGELFDKHVDHLTVVHSSFLRHWERLIDLEAKASQVSKQERLHPQNIRGERSTDNLSSIILDVTNGFSVDGFPKNGRFVYRFVRRNLPLYDYEMTKRENLDFFKPGTSSSDCSLRCGDRVILSTESGRVAVANGIIYDIGQSTVSISFPRRLRLPGNDSFSERGNFIKEVWRIDKDEFASSFATMRFNLIQLFVQSSQSLHLRRMIVNLEAPRFDSGGIFSQDPALFYVRSEESMNDDQRRAIHKILTAKDYTLILGMPGTGKTSTMIHAVKALLIRGASILLTSYTNSAVDNLLIKLKAQGIDFIRIGRHEVVHDDIRDHTFSDMEIGSVNDIKERMEHVHVVGATCLGVNHPLLANKKFDVCIMDEAGQITLPVSLGPLMLASTFVLVGDHYQLPPLVQSAEARENGMSTSLFCRLSEAHPQAISALQCQYRMCSGIMELSNALIYGNRLRCGSSEIANAKLKFSSMENISLWVKEVLDPNKPVVFVNTDGLPALEVREHKIVNNPIEAFIVSEITREMLKREVLRDEIGIITPYNSQVNIIRHLLDASVEIQTIDKYQGRDKDCILLSFVRSSENSRACTSSLLGDWHRINVALTRPKKKLIMVGSCRTLSKVPLLKLLIEKVDDEGSIQHISIKDIHLLKELKKCSQTSAK